MNYSRYGPTASIPEKNLTGLRILPINITNPFYISTRIVSVILFREYVAPSDSIRIVSLTQIVSLILYR